MNISDSILKDIREFVGLGSESPEFDKELLPHINSSISQLNQNGVGRSIIVKDDSTTWNELQDPEQTEGNKQFSSVPLFIALNTKILFDPPPPSNVEYYSSHAKEILWRLKIAYESG